MNTDPKAVLADWAAAVGNKSLLLLPAPPKIPNDGKIYLDALQFETDMAQRFGYLQQRLDVKSVVDHSVLDEAARTIN